MEIVLATQGFAGVGGSETYLLTVAEQLQRLGHGATIHALNGGPMAEIAAARGVPVAIGERGLPGACDAILVQDSGMAYALADRWPSTPQVFRACTELHDFQFPPQLPGVVAAVVVVSDRVGDHVAALAAEHEVVRLRHPIDTDRLVPRGEIRERPRRAVLLSNYLSGHRRALIEQTWGELGVECVPIGVYGTPSPEPQDAIAAADIVVGKARAILDGMACGRAAYVVDAVGGDGWVTGESYAAMEADNFAGHATAWTLSRERLADDLAGYRPEMGTVNRDLVLAHHGAHRHTRALVDLFDRLAPGVPPAATPLRELARLVRLQWATEQDAMALRGALLQERERAVIAETYAASLEAQRNALGIDRDELRRELARATAPRRHPLRRGT